jgi:CheY-like chemotaxis protein
MTNLKNKRIFYIEDNVQNRALIQLLLEQNGAMVSFERWGDHEDIQRRLAAFEQIDLILLDLMFPKNVSGYDIFDFLRGLPAYAQVPIVAISAADPATEMNKARAKGFSGYISKPISLIHFPEQISQILDGKPVWYAGD